jgi:hypothetical protein
MKLHLLSMIFILAVFITSCSGGNNSPVLPGDEKLPQDNISDTTEASDVLYVAGSSGSLAYKAFGIYNVTIDPVALTGEIIPSRNASAIGTTFDADLTQFLTHTPCSNCLQIDGIQLLSGNQVKVGFKIKHPFSDPAKRPDLHGFDVRGIVLAKGNYYFPGILVNLNETDTIPARANVSLMANPDGFTHHFDELATDENYFDPPRNYDANINPYKRYFTDGTQGTFDFAAPAGYNVMPCGSDWETQNYIFNLEPGGTTLDFGFIVDCAYGASAVFANRFNPHYFLPEFNRKEAWRVETTVLTNNLQSGDTLSDASISVQVSDWQAGMAADPNYPDTANLGGISVESDVASVCVEIPLVCSPLTVTAPGSGNGTDALPYLFDVNITNSLAAPAGTYYGLTAVRDDLQGQRGPIAIPESPAGFPYPGPEIYDYSTYNVFTIRVNGDIPDIVSLSHFMGVYENQTLNLTATVTEPDGDEVSYFWEQLSPASPVGIIVNPYAKDTQFIVPELYDIPITGIDFTLRLKASDVDGYDWSSTTFDVHENNYAPVCVGIETEPSYGVIDNLTYMDLFGFAYDADDTLSYEWDMDYDGITFDVDQTGAIINYQWPDQGYFWVACKATENRTNAQDVMCIKRILQEGMINEDFQIDNDPLSPAPAYSSQDVIVTMDVSGKRTYHVIYCDISDGSVHYCNNAGNLLVFSNHTELAPDLGTGYTQNTRLAVNGTSICAVWKQSTPSAAIWDYKIMFTRSQDNGQTWSTTQIIASSTDPNSIRYLDICKGTEPGEFYIFYTYFSSPNYVCWVLKTTDNGDSWGYPGPPSAGAFRDVVSNQPLMDPQIEMSANGVLHTFWGDYRTGTYLYYYDYSTDRGDTWNTDMVITSGTLFDEASMRVADNGDGYFVYHNDADGYKFIKTEYGAPPVLGPAHPVQSTIDSNQGNSLYITPDGSTIFAVLTYQHTGNSKNRYFFSFDDGLTWSYWDTDGLPDNIYWPDCTAVKFDDPAGIEVLNTWVDYRTSVDPNAHIFGEFIYLGERF